MNMMDETFANSDHMIDALHDEREMMLHHAYHIFEFLFAWNLFSGLFNWRRSRQQSPEELAQQIASEYGI